MAIVEPPAPHLSREQEILLQFYRDLTAFLEGGDFIRAIFTAYETGRFNTGKGNKPSAPMVLKALEDGDEARWRWLEGRLKKDLQSASAWPEDRQHQLKAYAERLRAQAVSRVRSN